MKIHVKPFGIARDIIGGAREMELSGKTVKDLRRSLLSTYPDLQGLKSLMIAVNKEYADDDLVLSPSDEVVLIPPVSGG